MSLRFPRQEYRSGLPFPSPGDLPDPGIEPRFPAHWPVGTVIECAFKPLHRCRLQGVHDKGHQVPGQAAAPLWAHRVPLVWHCTWACPCKGQEAKAGRPQGTVGGRAGCWLNCSHTPTNPPYLPVFVGLHTTLTDLLFFKGLLHLPEVCQESYVGTNLVHRRPQASQHREHLNIYFSCIGLPCDDKSPRNK